MEIPIMEATSPSNKQDTMNKPIIFSKKVNLVDKYNFYEYLAVMLDGGVSIEETLSSVSSKVTSPYFKEKINELKVYVSSWDSVSKSMKKIPQIFPSWEVSIVEAWEATGMLSESLSKLSDELKKVHELRNKIKTALTYPLIIFIFLFLAVLLVLTYVIPAIKPLFETSEVELPGATKALMFVSDFVSHNFPLLILVLFSVFVLFVWYKNTRTGKIQIEQFIFSFPLVWKVYKNYVLSSVSSTFWSLIGSGVSVIKTLNLVGKASNSHIYESLFDEIAQRVSRWSKIVESMKEVDPNGIYFPVDFLQMLSVWERTASLEKINKKISVGYEKEVDYSLTNLSKWIEPVAILIAWVFVLWFAFAIFWAILKVTQVVG